MEWYLLGEEGEEFKRRTGEGGAAPTPVAGPVAAGISDPCLSLAYTCGGGWSLNFDTRSAPSREDDARARGAERGGSCWAAGTEAPTPCGEVNGSACGEMKGIACGEDMATACVNKDGTACGEMAGGAEEGGAKAGGVACAVEGVTGGDAPVAGPEAEAVRGCAGNAKVAAGAGGGPGPVLGLESGTGPGLWSDTSPGLGSDVGTDLES